MSKAKSFLDGLPEKIQEAVFSKMFSADCIKAPNGKAVCMVWKNDLIFKLTGDEEKEALKLKGAHVFSPADGRTMGGWIQVPDAHEKLWLKLAKQSFDYVSAIEVKEKQKKTATAKKK
jgi:hypothetical protein